MALNESRTFQFVWQMQIGCVAFCYDTTQTQFASQTSQTTQTAEAISAAFALALNMSETMQLVWQSQESCREECHGASATQTVNQAQGTNQSAGSSTGSGGPDGVIGWLATLAANIGATLQTIFQYQDADCLENCMGGSQLQRALQHAATTQEASVGETPVETPASPADPASPSAAPPAETPAAAPEAASAAQLSYVEGRVSSDGGATRGQAALTEGSSRFSSTAAPARPAPSTGAGAGAETQEGALATERPSPTAESSGRSSRPAAASKPGAHANAPIEPSPLDDLGIKLTDSESSPFGDSSLWLALALLALTGVFLAAARAAQVVRM
jgi:hypothetical protein